VSRIGTSGYVAAVPQPPLSLATELAQRAGDRQLERLATAREDVTTKSSATDMVTAVDREIERLIVDGILAARPDDGILGEEGADVEGSSGYRWLIDPIDGTTNYLYGHPGFAVSIACERDGETVAGVVNDPVHGELFAATRGGGATRNGAPIRCSKETDVAKALVATGFSYDPDQRRAQGEVIARIIGEIRDIRRMGAAAVDLCSAACGRVDAYFERGLNPWDLAAGELIATEAGAVISSIEGGPARPGSVLAAPPALAEQLRNLLARAG
jgi:myo-inositol-1(or 4)-monophosphatase